MKTRLFAALTLLWTAVVLLLTLTPAAEMPRTPAWQLLSFDTAAHAGVFAVLAGLGWGWVGARQRTGRRAATAVLLGCVAFGGLIEVLQYVMRVGRHAEWSDLLSDAIGAALVLAWPLARGSRRTTGVVLAWLVGLSWSSVAAAQTTAPTAAPAPATTSPAPGPDLARARRTIETLASPEMRGRGYVGGGEHRAAAYLRGRLRGLGLQPLAPAFTQPFELAVNTFPGELKLKLLNGSARALRVGLDFIADPAAAPLPACWSHPLRLDTLVFTDTSAVRRLLRSPSLNGRVESLDVAPTRLPDGRQIPSLLLRARDEVRLSLLPTEAQNFIGRFSLRLVLVPKLTASVRATQEPLTRLEILASSWSSLTASTSEPLVQVAVDARLLPHYPTQNLAAVVRGTAQPDSFLVVSAHYDHLGTMGRRVYFPGANDNASGVALLLELAAHYARPENRPACSVVFLLFGAEEAGLVGSCYFVAHPLVPLKQIKFLLNLDLLGTGEEGATVVNGRLRPAAFARLLALNEAGRYLPRLTARGPAANSDHFPFSEAGVPAFFLYTRGGSLAYHDVHDTPAALSLAGFAGAYRLCREFLNQLGAR